MGARPFMMEMFSGRMVDPMNIRPEDVSILDIAHALARINRYGGNIDADHYSVAEHSVLVALIVPERARPAALMHDATEAYMGCDLVSPIKCHCPEYVRAEEKVAEAISIAIPYAWDPEIEALVKEADTRIRADEKRALLPRGPWWPTTEPLGLPVRCWPPREAETQFLHLFGELFGVETLCRG